MAERAFTLEVSVDEETGRLMACYLHVRKGEVAETKELDPGRAYADYNEAGQLIGVELLGPCAVSVLDRLAESEDEPVRRFVLGAAPRDLVLN
jgi:uncharacterized protein YuzE